MEWFDAVPWAKILGQIKTECNSIAMYLSFSSCPSILIRLLVVRHHLTVFTSLNKTMKIDNFPHSPSKIKIKAYCLLKNENQAESEAWYLKS